MPRLEPRSCGINTAKDIQRATGCDRKRALIKIGSFSTVAKLVAYMQRVRELAPLAVGAYRCVECLEPRGAGSAHRCRGERG